MRILAIEDEKEAERTRNILDRLFHGTGQLTVLYSREQISEWLAVNEPPELVIADTKIGANGIFPILDFSGIHVPIIYTTTDEREAKFIFEHNGIACIKKPVSFASLLAAMRKYRSMQHHFRGRRENAISGLLEPVRYPRRVIVKKGKEFYSIPLAHVACFYSKYKLSFAVTKDGREFRTVQDSLRDIAASLDPSNFFMANRKFLIHIDYIEKFVPANFGKISICLSVPFGQPIIVSQLKSTGFRRWVEDSGSGPGHHGNLYVE